MSEPREVEAKFDIGADGRRTLIAATTIGRFSVQGRRTAEQDDIYFDTDDGSLAAVSSTLRVRRTQRGAWMTYKGRRELASSVDEAHIASRLEDEVLLDAGIASAVRIDSRLPDMQGVSPLERARAIVADRPLWPVARIENRRTTLCLGDDAGLTLELAVDDCVGTRFSDGRRTAFEEVELESGTAGREALLEAASALREMVPTLRPSLLTKLGRTMG